MMIRVLCALTLVALGGTAIAAEEKAPAAGQPPKANCTLFKRASDGRWISTIDSKVGNPKSFVLIQAGRPIERDLVVVGINISETIDHLCGGK